MNVTNNSSPNAIQANSPVKHWTVIVLSVGFVSFDILISVNHMMYAKKSV